jgi:hypothetical protein
MKFIKVTGIGSSSTPYYINIAHIGHVFGVQDKYHHGQLETGAYTSIGVTTHNNGGFRVQESVEQVMKLILDVKG